MGSKLFLTSERMLLLVNIIISIDTRTEAIRKNGLTGTPMEAKWKSRKTLISIIVVARLLTYTL